MDNFARALAIVFEVEGGFTDDRRDPGGMTNFGITAATLARARQSDPSLPWTPAKLNKDQATAIYRRDYWDAHRCDDLPAGLDLWLFDCAVQHAPPNPVRWLQRALHVRDDGVLGPVTMAAVIRCTDVPALIAAAAAHRFKHYMMQPDEQREAYSLGWGNRFCGVLADALSWAA